MKKIGIKALQRYTIEYARIMTICMSDEELAAVIARLEPAENPNEFTADDVVNYITARPELTEPVDDPVGSLRKLEEFMEVLALRAPELGAEWKIDLDYKSEQNDPYTASCVEASVITLQF